MATTSPDEIWTPDGGDQYALTTDLAIFAGTVQDALNKRSARNGTTTQRNNFSSQAQPGALWWDTTVQALYTYTGGAWSRVAPPSDTGWTNITVSYNAFQPSSGNPPQYRVIGNVCYLSGSVGRTAGAPTSTLRFGILPSSARPKATVFTPTVIYGSEDNQPVTVQVSTNGEVAIRCGAHRSPSASPGYSISGVSFPVG